MHQFLLCPCPPIFHSPLFLLSSVVKFQLIHIPFGFFLNFSVQSVTWGYCRLYLMLTWCQLWWIWAPVPAWSDLSPWGSKMALCTRLVSEGPGVSQLLSVDFFCRFGGMMCVFVILCVCVTRLLLLVCVTIKGGSLLMILDLHGR